MWAKQKKKKILHLGLDKLHQIFILTAFMVYFNWIVLPRN